jgi:hypothetical protein
MQPWVQDYDFSLCQTITIMSHGTLHTQDQMQNQNGYKKRCSAASKPKEPTFHHLTISLLQCKVVNIHTLYRPTLHRPGIVPSGQHYWIVQPASPQALPPGNGVPVAHLCVDRAIHAPINPLQVEPHRTAALLNRPGSLFRLPSYYPTRF